MFNENSKDGKDALHTDYHNRGGHYYRELYSTIEHSTNERDNPSLNRSNTGDNIYSNGYYIISRGIQFFMDSQRQHYSVLNKYTFKPLSQLYPYPKQGIETVLPEYEDTLPVNAYRYEDALLHMKEGKGNLHKDIDSYQNFLLKTNNENAKGNARIKTVLDEELEKAGFDKKNMNQNGEIGGVETYVNLYLRQAVKSDNPYEYTNRLDPKLDGVSISDAAKNLGRA